MFDITGEHIAALNDADLRTIVALLCEAELRQLGLPTSAVTAGGNQDDADGGLDVRVDLPLGTVIDGFIPCPMTGYQVKVPNMTPAKIPDEMRKGGSVRPVIEELSAVSGAYIIISSKGSTADSALQNRRTAMRNAVGDLSNSALLALDFYDRNRLASWVRQYPGLISWVQEKVGQALQGWRPYASWAASDEAVDAEYLFDQTPRLHDWRSREDGPLTIEEGINRIREILGAPKGVVRLVGLSGVGKTRLVQALFDSRIGANPLDPALTVYTDIGASPDPTPRALMQRLLENRQRVTFIIDNCSPETHRALAEIANHPVSRISLITVEFDVGDDAPEKTEVFRLEPASEKVMEQLLTRHYPRVSQLDRRQIAEFSDGNARIALAIGHTVKHRKSVGKFSDRALFHRLFHQGRESDDRLLRAAEICSLVYSFNGEIIDGNAAELPFLAELAGLSTEELYRLVSELRARELIQRRGQWRAVLPQALANRLASEALERMPPASLSSSFLRQSERLIGSFSRRLGYLHDSEPAQQIVKEWLMQGAWLSDVTQLSDVTIQILKNVAPVVPEAVLKAIEVAAFKEPTFLATTNWNRHVWISLLKSLAYDPIFFTRATQVLILFVASEPANNNSNSARNAFLNLFQLLVSGTHATVDQRLEVVQGLLTNGNFLEQQLGFEALVRMLEAWHFNSSHGFDFGARSRDYGWRPQTQSEVLNWFMPVLNYTQHLACSEQFGAHARSILGKKFRGLLVKAKLLNELGRVTHNILAHTPWPEGWIAVRNCLRLGNQTLLEEERARLHELELALRPKDLYEMSRTYVFSEPWSALDIAIGEEESDDATAGEAFQRISDKTEHLGRQVAQDREVLYALLPDLVHRNVGRSRQFARGLAVGTADLNELWKDLLEAVSAVPVKDRDISILFGFLSGAAERDRETTDRFLDAIVVDPSMGPFFPTLQTAVLIDKLGEERLLKAIVYGAAPASAYKALAWGRATTEPISAAGLRRIILGIASLTDGIEVALEILGMRIHGDNDGQKKIDRELIKCGRELLRSFEFRSHRNDMPDYHLSNITNVCLSEGNAVDDVRVVCQNILAALSEYRLGPYDLRLFLETLLKLHPTVVLDEMLDIGTDAEDLLFQRGIDLDEASGPIDKVPADILIHWAEISPERRFPLLASAVNLYQVKTDEGGVFSWSETALKILRAAPDRIAVLNKFGENLRPTGWSGSLAELLEKIRSLPAVFLSDPDPHVVAWAREQDTYLRKYAESERLTEKRTDERFE